MTVHPLPPSPSREGQGEPAALSPAKLPRRLAAVIYDGLLLAGVLVAASGLAMGVIALAAGSGESVKAGGLLTSNPFFRTYLLLVCFLFYGGFWVRGGQTLGLRAWRLRLQQRDGGNIRWQQALLRFLSGGVWLIPMIGVHQALQPGIGWSLGIGLGSLLLLLALHLPDRWSETELVVLPKAPA